MSTTILRGSLLTAKLQQHAAQVMKKQHEKQLSASQQRVNTDPPGREGFFEKYNKLCNDKIKKFKCSENLSLSSLFDRFLKRCTDKLQRLKEAENFSPYECAGFLLGGIIVIAATVTLMVLYPPAIDGDMLKLTCDGFVAIIVGSIMIYKNSTNIAGLREII